MAKKITKSDSKRILWIDVVKIIAIYFVIVIHTGSQNTFLQIIINTSVPLFVMASGALLLQKKEEYSLFFKKRIRKVLMPWILWTIIYMFWQYLVNHYSVTSRQELQYFFELTFLTQLWFLPLIFGLYLITPMLRLFTLFAQLKDIIYIILLWFAAVSIIPSVHSSPAFPLFPNNDLLRQIISFSGYFLLGFLLFKIKIPKHTTFISVVIILSIFLFILFTKVESAGFLSPVVVILSSVLFIFIRKVISLRKSRFSSIIIAASKASFGIYLSHQLFMWSLDKAIMPIKEFLNSTFEGLVLGLIFFLLSFFFIFILQKVPILKYLVP